MEILVSVEGVPGVRAPRWPAGWAVPPIGSAVSLYGVDTVLMVLYVVWFPQGSDDDSRAHVQLVLGRAEKPH